MEIYLLLCEQCNRSFFYQSEIKSTFTFDLQLFAGEKTEEATPKRQADSRKKGQVGKSQEINSVFIIFSAFMALKILGTYIYNQIAGYMVFVFTNLPTEVTAELVMRIILDIGAVLARTSLPIMFTIMIIAVVVNLFQVGINFTLTPIMPKLSKLDPIAGSKRMFSKRSLVELVKSIIKIVIIGYFIYRFLVKETAHLPKLIYVDLETAMHIVATLIFTLAFQICGVMIVLAALDFLYQKWEHRQSIKMSKHDVKEEGKQSEGNPEIKSKIKQKQRALAMQRMMQEVPKADVIVTNPTHLAIALKYEAGMAAPVVVAKGQDLVAQRIKAIAKEAKIVIVENKPLARALYSATNVGDVVPQELYKSVAEVLAYVYRLKKKLS